MDPGNEFSSGSHLAVSGRMNHLLRQARSSRCWPAAILVLAVSGEALASGPSAGDGIGLVTAIGLAVASAAAISIIFHRFQQPALLAYIVAGLVLQQVMAGAPKSTITTMEEVSHLGLVFLLFIIGMEMDLRGILRMGKGPAAAVLLQAPIAAVIIIGVQWIADFAGQAVPGLGSQRSEWFYYAVVVALSSTAVVVKLLGDKFDLGSQAGKITMLTLIAQDIWAVAALSYVTIGDSGSKAGSANPLSMLSGIVVVVAVIILATKWFLSPILARLARSPDLLALAALGWCFLCAEAISRTGLSAEMGALLGGLSIGRLPVRVEVLSRVMSLRDFFMALFFVSLGILLPTPSLAVLSDAIPLVIIVVLSRLLLFAPALFAVRQGSIVSIASSVNLAQISEFALLIIPVGIMHGALAQHDVSVISYAMMFSVLLSTYAIRYNYNIAIAIERILGRGHLPSGATLGAAVEAEGHPGAEIVFLGHYLNSDALAERLSSEAPELLDKILVIDFNLRNHPRIRASGLNVAYGDISNPEVLRHFGIAKAKVVICTISNTFLRGTSNEELFNVVKTINPQAKFIATSSNREKIEEFVGKGAWACISSEIESSSAYLAAIKRALQS